MGASVLRQSGAGSHGAQIGRRCGCAGMAIGRGRPRQLPRTAAKGEQILRSPVTAKRPRRGRWVSNAGLPGQLHVATWRGNRDRSENGPEAAGKPARHRNSRGPGLCCGGQRRHRPQHRHQKGAVARPPLELHENSGDTQSENMGERIPSGPAYETASEPGRVIPAPIGTRARGQDIPGAAAPGNDPVRTRGAMTNRFRHVVAASSIGRQDRETWSRSLTGAEGKACLHFGPHRRAE